MKKVLFVCVENSCRSQMAEAFAKIYGKDIIKSYSAGSRASGKINEKAIKTMQDVGYNLNQHQSTSLDDIPDIEYDLAITMGCGDECPYVIAKQRQAWDIPDPKNMNSEGFIQVREMIKQNILSLIHDLKA